MRVLGRVDSNWLRGEAGGRHGIFPASYVERWPRPGTGVTLTARRDFQARGGAELSVTAGERLQLERWVDPAWLEVRLGERTGIAPAAFFRWPDQDEEAAQWREAGRSFAAGPEPGVSHEPLCRPSQLLKSALREEFSVRERRMAGLENLLSTQQRALTGEETHEEEGREMCEAVSDQRQLC